MRKLTSILLLILLICNSVFCQNKGKNQEKAEHEAIQQIRTSGLADILSFQTQNRDINNMVLTHQIGDQNKASINQQAESGFGNQSYSIQQGNSNEMTVGQIGSGNVLLGFQLGYVTSEIERNQGNHYGFGLDNGNGNAYAYGHEKGTTETIVAGDRNKLVISQEGSNNGVLAVQQGSDNSISAGQKGTNNYLLLMQQGNRNSISGYEQESQEDSPNLDAIIQIGNDHTFSATDQSKSKPNGNSFRQEGEHLSLQINNQFANTLGGIEINQTGHDMKVVVDQSFFLDPLR